MTDKARFEAALQRANHVVFLLKTVRDQLIVLQAMEADATRDLEAARDALIGAQSSHMDPHPDVPAKPTKYDSDWVPDLVLRWRRRIAEEFTKK